MSIDEIKDKFGWFFKVTSYIFRPYLRMKYQRKKAESFEDKLIRFFVWIGSWVVVGAVYFLFMYLFIYKGPNGEPGKLVDFINNPPIENGKAFLQFAGASALFNLTFFIVLYYAIISFAEKEFLKGANVHLQLSGLLKTIKLGKYDSSSNISEQNNTQIRLARKNIIATLSEDTKETVSIVSASGYDLFGEGPPLKEENSEVNTDKKSETKKNPFKFWGKNEGQNFNNGYCLTYLKERYKKVRVVLLDPDCDAAEKRAERYMSDKGHNPLITKDEYKKAIKKCIENLKIIYKDNPNVEVRLIKKLPQWKIIMVEGEAWVQPILPGVRSDHTPLYGYKKNDYSLYHTFFNIFESLWHDEDSKRVELF